MSSSCSVQVCMKNDNGKAEMHGRAGRERSLEGLVRFSEAPYCSTQEDQV